MVDNLAVIDYTLCTRCGVCVAKCPQKCILLLSGDSSETPVSSPT
jgi:Pyruvate/2-oxoacid:ferredoxin oxidoreductase delta subunit